MSMQRSLLVKIHAATAMAATATIAIFWTSTVAVELFGSASAVTTVKTGIAWAMLWMVPLMAATGISGARLAGANPKGVVAAKLKRMKVIAANGLCILVPSAIFLALRANEGVFDGLFIAVQGLELAAGALNLTLMAANARDGFRLSGRLRTAGPARR
jgi:hypothetical protein